MWIIKWGFNKYATIIVLFFLLMFVGCKSKENRNSSEVSSSNEVITEEGDLFLAALEGDLEQVLKFLVSMDIDSKDSDGRTALMYAAYNGHEQIVSRLIEKGAEVNLSDNYGRTALIFSSSGPFPETTKLLLDNHAEIDACDNVEHFTALMYAAFNGHEELVRQLIKNGATINVLDNYGRTPLMFASSGPFPGTTKLLLENEAEVNLYDNEEHFTALMYAAAEGQADNVELLLSYHANPDIKDIDGDMAIDFAQTNGHQEVVHLLEAVSK